MVKRTYQLQLTGKNFAKAIAANKPVSVKYATEIAREIKGKPLKKAEQFLKEVILHVKHLPLRKYKKKVPHRKGNAVANTKTGRYPEKACKAFLKLLESAKANAVNQGLDEEKLLVKHAFASHGFHRLGHQPKGRIAGKRWKKKSAHLEVILQEVTAL
jgi:large subunit ribosomal protein L22